MVSFIPVLTVNGIIKFGDDITKRATRMAKGDTAIHTPGRLLVQFFIRVQVNKLVIIFYTFGSRYFLQAVPC